MDPKFPNQVFYVWWSIYRQFVLNRGWKRDSLQIMIFVYISSSCPNQAFNFLFFDLQIICAKYGLKNDTLQITIFENVCSTWSMVEIKSRFEAWITKNDVNGVILIHLSYLITLMAYLWSQWKPNVQIKYIMFDWWIYFLFVLNRCWKSGTHQIIIFVYISSTLSIVELKTCFESWITRNDVNGVNLFHLSYLITRFTCAHKGHQMSIQI
jgi:hypothetical protein